jgi:sigma-B regulation protein RsbU (phosphoserine phosphatase)
VRCHCRHHPESVHTALIERAGTTDEYITAACVTCLPGERLLRWAYVGHPPALSLDDGRELVASRQGTPLGVREDPGCEEGSRQMTAGQGALLYTDGLTEARHDGHFLGLEAVTAALAALQRPGHCALRAPDFACGARTDDVCLLGVRIN